MLRTSQSPQHLIHHLAVSAHLISPRNTSHQRPHPAAGEKIHSTATHKMTLKQTLTACATIAAMSACSNAPPTSTANFRNQGYLLDTAGNNAVVKSLGYDVCVRTSDWTPARAIVECDPDLVPKPIAKPPVAAPVVAPKPEAVPTPAPKVQAQPTAPAPAPAPQRFTLSADTLFDFDKTVLGPEGRKKLDDLADALRGTQHDTIVANGHTDRVGSLRYNQRLSERRADAVKKYLQEKGLDVGKISAAGKGKSQPVTKATDCRGPKMNRAAVRACLQPDRRVEIEVSGTKVIDPNAPPAAKPAAKTATKGKPAAAK
jgi:OmpA-OmpF porin, OOP family